MKRFDKLDILKYFACFFVIMAHMDMPQAMEFFVQPFLRAAVPVFFMITGFFYQPIVKAGKDQKQLRKIAVLALAANGVHIVWCCVKCVIGTESLKEFIAKVFDPASLVRLLVFNQPVWRTSIWYINALLVVLLLFRAVRKCEDYRTFYWLIPLLLGGNLLLSTYAFVFPFAEPPALYFSRNFLFCGVPFFLLGMYVHQNRQRVCGVFGRWSFAVLFFAAGCAELWTLHHFGLLYHKDLLLTGPFLALSLFCLCVKTGSDVGAVGKKMGEWGRRYCFIIYVSHSILIEIAYKVVNVADGYIPFAKEIFSIVGPLVILAASTLLASAFTYCKARICKRSAS